MRPADHKVVVNTMNGLEKKRKVEIGELSLAVFTVLTFTVQLFTHIIASNSLLIIYLFMLAVFFIASNYSQLECRDLQSFSWLIALIVVGLASLRTVAGLDYFSVNPYVDSFVFLAGISVVLFSPGDTDAYRLSMNIILFFAIYYALSVWLQVLFPSFYQGYINLLPQANRMLIMQGADRGQFFTGFSANPGYTAGFIICGIILLFSRSLAGKEKRLLNLILLLFLAASLLLTGRRAHTIFLIVTLMGMYTLPYKGKKLKKHIFQLATVLVLLVIIFFAFRSFLVNIPLFSRFSNTLSRLKSGADISSGRSRIYAHAWKLFKENPVFGIGWGNFRYSSTGNVASMIEMQTHNIYLQLLCEMGILGSIVILLPILSMFYISLKNIRQVDKDKDNSWSALLSYSFGSQMFFLLYGLTGNPLYDANFSLMYFLSSSINMSYIHFQKRLSLSSDLYFSAKDLQDESD